MLYCTETFKIEYDKLSSHKSYSNLESTLINLFNKGLYTEIASGNRLFNSPPELTFYKKRVPDAGGYRLYQLCDHKTNKVFCTFIHPKSGKFGYENVNTQAKKQFFTDGLELRKGIYKDKCYKITIESNKLKFMVLSEIDINKEILSGTEVVLKDTEFKKKH